MWDVHYDYAPPPPYDRMFDPDYQGSITGDDYSRNDKVSRKMDRRDLEHVRALYDGEIRFTDDHLGEIVANLRRLGVLDDTIVVVTSDHGDEFFEHGLKGHGVALYDEVVHVPLVIRYPERIAPGQRITEQVRLMDIAPTILGLAQIAAPPDFAAPGLHDRAIDLSPWLVDGGNAERPGLPAFSQTLIGLRHESVRTQHAKLIQRINEVSGKTFVMLYDLAADPRESYNLNREKPPPSSRQVLDGLLSAWRIETGREKSLAIPLRHEPEQEDRLRALGYVQ
jgi:arylsulfatase A-like enzyme